MTQLTHFTTPTKTTYFIHPKGASFFMIMALFCLGLFSCTSEKKEEYTEVSEVESIVGDGYVGDQNCQYCHKEESAFWQGSHHDKAMQEVNAATVLGDFNERSISLDGVDYYFFQKDSEYHVQVKELDGTEYDYVISYVFGITPLQQYMVDFPGGRKQVLRVSWDTEKNIWFHQYAEIESE